MSLDFPRAWELARAAAPEAHHPECSYMQSNGGLLCDLACPVIADAAEFQCGALHGKGGKVVETNKPYARCSCGGAR